MARKYSKWPVKIRSGSAEVRVYRIRWKDSPTGWIYSVAWYEGTGRRRQRQFHRESKALAEARLKVDLLAAGENEAGSLTRSDVRELQAARDIAGDTGLLPALREWEHGRELCGGSIIQACQSWAEKLRPTFTPITVQKAVIHFLEMKEQVGVQTTRGAAITLKRFVEDHGAYQLASLNAHRIETWLNQFSNPSTRNTHRKRLVTLWRWARKSGFLPRDAQTAAEQTERAREEAPDVQLISAADFSAILNLIAEKHPHYLPAVVLAGFCGLRRIEIRGQRWEDVLVDRRLVRVTTAKRGTPARRLVPLCDAAALWLERVKQDIGPINAGNTWQMDRIRDIGRTAGIRLPPNCFRNSFISNRVAVTENVDQVAIEAGNSRIIIFRHYRELVTKEEGTLWFSKAPQDSAATNPIPFLHESA